MLVAVCEDIRQICFNARQILVIIKLLLKILQWTVPIILIILGTIDMFKAMTTNDEKVSKEAVQIFIKRLIMGVLIFFVPFIVKLVLEITSSVLESSGEVGMNNWLSCWTEIDNKNSNYFYGCKNIYVEDGEEDLNKESNTSKVGICTYYIDGLRITTKVTENECNEKNGEFSLNN